MRTWVYDKLTTTPAITALVDPLRVIAGSALRKAPDTKPFITYRMHPQQPRLRRLAGRSQYLQVWVHDVPGDFMRIDEIIEAVVQALNVEVNGGGILECKWIESSADLPEDPDLGTIARFARFQIYYGENYAVPSA